MKVYSEVLAETAGKVVAIPAKDGALVQQGEPLLFLEPL
jgi:biotin carboxyl carrier protein